MGEEIDESNPLVDARLDDLLAEVNVMIPPLALDGTYISIRKFNENKLTLSRLAQFGAMSKSMVKLSILLFAHALMCLLQEALVQVKPHFSMRCLLAFRLKERIITIEDTAELRLQQPHVVRAETRPANAKQRQ